MSNKPKTRIIQENNSENEDSSEQNELQQEQEEQQIIKENSLLSQKLQQQQSQTDQIGHQHRKFLLQNAQFQARKDDKIFENMLMNFNSDGDNDEEEEDDMYDDDNDTTNQSQQKVTKKIKKQNSDVVDDKIQKQNQQIWKELITFVTKRGAEITRKPNLISKKFTSHTLITLKCTKNHIWDSSLKILQNHWCSKCQGEFKKVKQYAINKKGRVLSLCLEDNLKFECKFQHEFELDLRTYKKQWCSICFENTINRVSDTDQSYQEALMYASKKLAQDFINENSNLFNLQDDFDKIWRVIYVIDFPTSHYVQYLKSLSKDEFKSHKFTILRSIHPDNNHFPQAKNAISKFNSIIEEVQGGQK